MLWHVHCTYQVWGYVASMYFVALFARKDEQRRGRSFGMNIGIHIFHPRGEAGLLV